jgi:hypothetical protein
MITVIADIAGQFDALMRLVDRVPKDERIVLVGDLVDRGHSSFEVMEWAIANWPRVTTLLGNHEHMMWDFYRNETFGDEHLYGSYVWRNNGGDATVDSYRRQGFERPPDKHLTFIEGLPWFFETPDLFVSHAPLKAGKDAVDMEIKSPLDPEFDQSLIWNRTLPAKIDGKFQVFGHNSHWGLRKFDDWAICIDQSRKGILTGFKWPSREIIEEPYVTGAGKEKDGTP